MDKEKLLKRGMFYFLCSKSFFNDLNKLDIPYAVIKGEPLSMQAYNSFGERIYGDIDLLVDRKNIKLVEECLAKNNFFQTDNYGNPLTRENRILCMSYSHQTSAYKLKIDKCIIEVDLNFDIFWGEYSGKKIKMQDFLSDIIPINIFGCDLWTLTPLKGMIQLILHHYKDMNSIFILSTGKGYKFSMFKDIYYLLANNRKEITIESLHRISVEYEIIPYVFYMLYYTGQIFEDADIRKFIEVFRTPAGEELLNYYGLHDGERKKWRVDFQTRLKSENLYRLIEADLTEKDIEKIKINEKFF